MNNDRKEQIGDILLFFKDKPVNGDVLREFCARRTYELLTPNQYEECRAQQEHDDRVTASLTPIFAELSKFRHIAEFISAKEHKAIVESNEDIEWKIAKIVEDTGLPYGREVDVVFRNLASAFHGIITNAGTRMNNMCANALSAIAKEKFGDVITVQQLGRYYRENVLKVKDEPLQEKVESDMPSNENGTENPVG